MTLDPAMREILRPLLGGRDVEEAVLETLEQLDPEGRFAHLFSRAVLADVAEMVRADADLLARADVGKGDVFVAQLRHETLRSVTAHFCAHYGLDERRVLAEWAGRELDVDGPKVQALSDRIASLALDEDYWDCFQRLVRGQRVDYIALLRGEAIEVTQLRLRVALILLAGQAGDDQRGGMG